MYGVTNAMNVMRGQLTDEVNKLGHPELLNNVTYSNPVIPRKVPSTVVLKRRLKKNKKTRNGKNLKGRTVYVKC